MAVLKCKMCGGSLEISNETVAQCAYCGTLQTLPRIDDERRANLYERANSFRRSNEFDRASVVYEQILSEDTTDAESYWSLVLCRYGIEYVEDPVTHKRVPTVNRAQLTSIFDDDNYKLALQYADGYQRSIYEEEANEINEIQKGILAISQKEEPFDVFICYKETDNNGRRTPDSVLANDLYHQLVQEGFKVFFSRITLEDKIGSAYEPYIFAALNSAKVMVVLGTKPEYFNAPWVKNEWSRYLALVKKGENKMLVPAYKDMDPYDLPDEFSHLQAQDMSKLGFMQDLIRGIKKILRQTEAMPNVSYAMPNNNGNAFCTSCGHPIISGMPFCANCGSRVGSDYQAKLKAEQLQAERNEMRQKSIDMLEETIRYFGKKQAQFKEYHYLSDLVIEFAEGANKVLLVFGIIIASIGAILLLPGWVVAALFFLVPGGLMLLGGILMQINNKKKYARYLEKYFMVTQDLTYYCNAYSNCPVSKEYCDPEVLQKILQKLTSGKAGNIEECMKLIVADSDIPDINKHKRKLQSSTNYKIDKAKEGQFFIAAKFIDD